MHSIYDKIQVDEMNKDILKGISRTLGRDTVGFVDNLWRDSLRALTPEIREKELIRYHGYSIIPIHERTMREKDVSYSPYRKGEASKINYPTNRSNSVPVNFKFSIREGTTYEDIYIMLKIPYVGRNGITTLSGTDYYIAPILSDILITPQPNGVFIKLDSTKFKIKIESTTITYLAPDSTRFEKLLPYIPTAADLVKVNKREGSMYGSPKIPLHVYLFYKYGVESVYRDEIHLIKRDEIVKFKEDGFHIYSVPDVKPKGHLKWEKSDICVAVKELPDNHGMMVISSILHVLYHFPFTGKEMLRVVGDKRAERGFWEVNIGRLIHKGLRSEVSRLKEVKSLFVRFDSFVSGRIINKLESIGLNGVEDFFGLIREVLLKLDELKADHLAFGNNFSYREIDIHYYLLYPYIESVNKIINAINNVYKKEGTITRDQFKGITGKDYNDEAILKKIFRKPRQLTLMKTESSSDNLAYKMTTSMIPQEVGKGSKREESKKKKSDSIPSNMQGLHGSFPYIGNMLKLSKGTPVALASINPFLKVDNEGQFLFTDEDKYVMNTIDKILNETGGDLKDENVLGFSEDASDE